MTLFLTGSPTRFGEPWFTRDNGFLDAVRAALPNKPRVLLVSAAPDDDGFTESVLKGMSDCIHLSGIETESIIMLRRANAHQAKELVNSSDWVILCGGHVPTQNRFINEIGLGPILKAWDGVVMGCSAGSMNCADRVYSHPELAGEAIDTNYSRWLRGLCLTNINLIPHYDQVRHVRIDNLALFEDIIYPDSWQHRFFSIPDGGYILVKNGRSLLYGRGWEISHGGMRQVGDENKITSIMNFVFISPHFPHTYSHFCRHLKEAGVTVLGIADAPYEQLTSELRDSLTEYYKVSNLENYDEVYRAVAFFAFKYGHIDWIESNNEYWLEQDARLRTDFNVTTGIHTDHISAIKEKSQMKKYYALGKIPTARQVRGVDGPDAVRAFAAKAGFPMIAKPDNGVGAAGTYKFNNAAELDAWLSEHSNDLGVFVLEEFITGLLVSYDAICDSRSEPLFESMGVFPTPIMDIVAGDLDTCYYVDKTVPAALKKLGRRTIKAFGIRSRFVHLEFFRLDRDREGLGRKGDFVGLEVNMRPAGGYTPDMMNFAHSTDVYQIWAEMVAYDRRLKDEGEQFICAYAGRRDCHSYVHSHEEVLARYGSVICMCDRMPAALASALSDQVYMARFHDKKEADEFFSFVCTQR